MQIFIKDLFKQVGLCEIKYRLKNRGYMQKWSLYRQLFGFPTFSDTLKMLYFKS